MNVVSVGSTVDVVVVVGMVCVVTVNVVYKIHGVV